MSKSFIDSNTILYLFSSDTLKADKVEAMLANGGIISVQVLNEVVSVCRRKLKLSWDEIDALLLALKANLQIVPLTVATHDVAIKLCKQYQLSFYDAHICSAALIAQCKHLLSEDMQHGLNVDELLIQNPFNNELFAIG